jgi:hypothetical protein
MCLAGWHNLQAIECNKEAGAGYHVSHLWFSAPLLRGMAWERLATRHSIIWRKLKLLQRCVSQTCDVIHPCILCLKIETERENWGEIIPGQRQSWVGQCDKFGSERTEGDITEKFSLQAQHLFQIDWLFNQYAPCCSCPCSCIVADNQAVLVSGRSMFFR